MAFNAPFAPLPAQTIGFSAGVASQSRQIPVSAFWPTASGSPQTFPPQIRVYNAGTAVVWIWFSATTATLTIPTPGTTTVGTPQFGIPIVPGILEVYTLTNFQGGSLWLSDISTAASQIYWLTPGEGL